ncbi:hypothetical protein MBLNU457_5726t1 [Dothideomycetes sp. NU457]
MDGKNSTGRKVSLLNDFGGASQTAIPFSRTLNNSHINRYNHPSNKLASLSSISTSSCSNTSARSNSQSPSSASTAPSLSPQTPPLVRSESNDSRTFASSPSPVTPHFATFDHQSPYSDRHHQLQQPATAFPAKHHHHRHHIYYAPPTAPQGPPRAFYYRPYSYAKMDDPSASVYPPLPDANSGVMAYPLSASNATVPSPQQQQHLTTQIRSSASPSSDAHATNGASKLLQPKKNQYPCPMAKEYQCTDYFTTSGHAARHAKKHTGKKDAFCPECNKAFTRKDNMEQHRRTHQNVRGPSKNPSAPSANNSDTRVKKSTKQSRKPDNNKLVAASIEAAVNQQLDDQQQMMPQAQPLMASSQPQQAPTTLPQPIMSSGAGPYFVHADPIQSLPQPMPIDFSGRPPLYRSNYPNSLDYIPQAAPTLQDASDLHFNYPSPGLSNGLNTLALAASDHRRMSEEDSNHSS